MSGIGPTGEALNPRQKLRADSRTGWSYSLNFANRLTAIPAGPNARPGGSSGLVYLAWIILRLALGVDQGELPEVLSSLTLTCFQA